MPSLLQLHSAHAPLLLIDAASANVQVGWLPRSPAISTTKEQSSPAPFAHEHWRISAEEAGVGVFRLVEELGVDVRNAGAFIFCDGPGSILGIRTVAMALRTWQLFAARPIFAYCSLALVAHALDRAEAGIIADARRDWWHYYRLGESLRRVATSELSGELAMPENFRHWSEPPANLTRVPYVVSDLLPRAAHVDLFHATDAPDAFLHAPPNYATWTPQIHRAPPLTTR
jgi:tRNA threonylcarbamoyladenosine biosynthesis protein TsaB